MGYFLQAFIGKKGTAQCVTAAYDKAVSIEIGQGLSIIPMTKFLFNQINSDSDSNCLEGFEYMTENVEANILKYIGDAELSYVEAEYHGSQGGQIGITWMQNRRQHFFPFGQNAINLILRSYGIAANKNQDEFETLGLGLYRNTDDWLDD